ncbi:MAG TPA: ParB/RepB/Spo0J family partition protein [Xanthobacteraceae bacterium]
MADDAGRSRLGRGLASLMGDVGAETQASERGARSQRKVPIEFVRANPRNPRKLFSDTELSELADSIRERGVIQPIVVRARGADHYEIIAGERRWRASQRAGLHEIPVVVLDVSDAEALELAIIENVQRSDLNPLEEASGYLSLSNEYSHSQEDIAKIVGKSRSHIANTLRLLHLPEKVKAYINSGKLTAGHARMLVGQPNAEELADQIVDQGLNVRQVEAMARDSGRAKAREGKRGGQSGKDANTEVLERRLADTLGLTVTIDHRSNGGGTLHVKYRTLEQLDDVVARLERGPNLG